MGTPIAVANRPFLSPVSNKVKNLRRECKLSHCFFGLYVCQFICQSVGESIRFPARRPPVRLVYFTFMKKAFIIRSANCFLAPPPPRTPSPEIVSREVVALLLTDAHLTERKLPSCHLANKIIHLKIGEVVRGNDKQSAVYYDHFEWVLFDNAPKVIGLTGTMRKDESVGCFLVLHP